MVIGPHHAHQLLDRLTDLVGAIDAGGGLDDRRVGVQASGFEQGGNGAADPLQALGWAQFAQVRFFGWSGCRRDRLPGGLLQRARAFPVS